METKIKFPFNPELPSSLSKERINEINDLCLKSQFNEDGLIADNEVNEHSLIIETCALQSIYEEIYNVGMSRGFYSNIDYAFQLLLEQRPQSSVEIFNTYRELTGIFRVLEKHETLIGNKLQEANNVLADLDKLEDEHFDRKELAKTA